MKSTIYLDFLFLGLLLIATQPSNGLVEPDEQAKLPHKQDAAGFYDFNEYKDKHGKHYSSLVEEMDREKIYLKNQINSFVSKMNYKNKNSDKYLAVNDLSDRDDDELQATLTDPEVAHYDLDQMIPDEKFEAENKETTKSDRTSGFKSKLNHAKSYLSNRMDLLVKDAANVYTQLRVDMPSRRKDLPDEVFIDHRKSGCLNEVRDKGQCGSGAIFSTNALYEWAYCKMSGNKISFSEQYPIDCGRKLGLFGCKGNDPVRVAWFYRDYGFELLNDYPYQAKNNQCPFGEDDKLPKDKMGSIRMGHKKSVVKYIAFREIEDYLRIAPVIISVRMSKESFHYGGGLDDGKGCEKSATLKSMLIVGSGRQDGYEYWIMGNSHGPQWGENGYYRLKKRNNCYMVLANGLAFNTIDPKDPKFKYLKNKVEPITMLRKSKAPKFIDFIQNKNHDKFRSVKKSKSGLGRLLGGFAY